MILHARVPCIGKCLLATILLISAPLAAAEKSPEAESAREPSFARAAEESPTLLGGAALLESSEGAGVGGPLSVGVDDVTVQVRRVDVVTNSLIPAFVGFQVWGAAYDPVGEQVDFNNHSTLDSWAVGGRPHARNDHRPRRRLGCPTRTTTATSAARRSTTRRRRFQAIAAR